MKYYHTYVDEGGIFGNITIFQSNKRLRESEDASYIGNYYIGKLRPSAILRLKEVYSQLFNQYDVRLVSNIKRRKTKNLDA